MFIPSPQPQEGAPGRHFGKKPLCCAAGSVLGQGSRVPRGAISICRMNSPGVCPALQQGGLPLPLVVLEIWSLQGAGPSCWLV